MNTSERVARSDQSAPGWNHTRMLCLSRTLRIKVHQALCLSRTLRVEVHKVLTLHVEVHQVLRLPRNLHFKVYQALRLPRNLHFEVHQTLCLPRNLQASHMSKSHDSLHLSRNPSSSTKVLHLPRKLHFEVKQLRSKVDFGAPKHEVSLAPATKSDHHVPKCARHHNESTIARSTRRQPPDSASLRS